MASRRPTTDAVDLRAVHEQLAHLSAIIEQQQQLAERQQQLAERQQAEIVALREALAVVRAKDIATPAYATSPAPLAKRQRRAQATSRRRLLAGAGVAAAAATVALVTSEGHGALASAATDGNNLQLGMGGNSNNTASSTTTLSVDTTPSHNVSPLFVVDASNSTASAPVAIQGISNVASGVGVSGTSSDNAGFGVHGTNSSSGVGVSGTSTSGTGVYGQTTSGTAAVWGSNAGSGYAVLGSGSSGYGVYGVSTSSTGVIGQSTSGYGVYGSSTSSTGVYGSSTNQVGVVAVSGSSLDLLAEGTGRIQQLPQGGAGAPTTGSYSKGEQIRDLNGELWLCIQSGSPGHWVQASHAVYGYTGGATSYLSKPIRLLDTRSGSTDALTNGGGPYTAGGSPYPVTIAGVSFMSVTVPSSCAGAIGNVTVVAGGGGGYLALVPHGAGFSGTANLAYSAGQIVSNSFNVGLSGGKLDIIIGGNPTDVILDLFAVVA